MMKKPILALSTILCLGAIHMSVAQPVAPTYGRTLVQTKRSLISGEYLEAEGNARKSLTLATSPEEKSSALILLGESFYKRKMFAQAITQWNKVVALDDTKSDNFKALAHFAMARSYAIQGDTDNTIAQCLAASTKIENNPYVKAKGKQNLNTVFALLVADAYFRASQLDAAKEQFAEILEENRSSSLASSIALFKLGQIEFARINYRAALTRFEQVLKIENARESIKKQAQVQIKALTTLLPYEAKFKASNRNSKIKLQNLDQTIIEDLIDEMILGSFPS